MIIRFRQLEMWSKLSIQISTFNNKEQKKTISCRFLAGVASAHVRYSTRAVNVWTDWLHVVELTEFVAPQKYYLQKTYISRLVVLSNPGERKYSSVKHFAERARIQEKNIYNGECCGWTNKLTD